MGTYRTSPIRVLLSRCSFLSNQRRLVNHGLLIPSCPLPHHQISPRPPISSSSSSPLFPQHPFDPSPFTIVPVLSVVPVVAAFADIASASNLVIGYGNAIASHRVRVPSNHALLRDYSGITRDGTASVDEIAAPSCPAVKIWKGRPGSLST